MKKNNLNLSIDAELMDCLNSAYTDLQILLKDTFTNVGQMSGQLTFEEFTSLFMKWDWLDIFNLLEELENASDLHKTESLISILTQSLKSNREIKALTNLRENTYYKVWAGLMIEEDLD